MAAVRTLALSVLFVAASANLGVDFYALTDQSVFSCMANNGIDRVIIRGYRSLGEVDPSLAGNLQNAVNGGVPIVDVYLFPCVSCGNPSTQATSLWSSTVSANSNFQGTVWLDIETGTWGSDLAANQQFILSLANTLQSSGANVGIYTSYYNWEAIVGLDWTGVSQFPLWYAHYDNNPAFSDFTPFGGWSSPTMKQYNGGATVCGAWVDSDFY